ncbi:MAG TPA: hypothetical protein VIL10_01265 [Marmoricola sp.]|jgi:hypothetical protein
MEFDTAVARARVEDEEEVAYPFTIVERDPDTDAVLDKVVCHAYHPGDGQVIVLIADTMGRRSSTSDKIAGIIDFFTDVLDDESKEYIVRRLMDRRDPFGLADVEPIVFYLVEEWGGRPTKQPSDFSRSQKVAGQKSTPRTRKSTSSASRRTAS